jgi:hypothetical protein
MRTLSRFCLAAVLAAIVAIPAAAQIEKEKSIFTVTDSIQVGSKVVPPGTYLIRVVPLSYNRNLVQVTSEDGSKVFASALATPHPKRDDEQIPSSRFLYYPTAEGQVKALRTWFAPSTPYGQDIVYPKKRASELAIATKESVVAIPEETTETEYKTVPYTTITREGTEAVYTAPQPETRVAQVDTAPAAAPAPPVKSLPRTASDVPLAALLGSASLALAFVARRRQA